MSALWYLLNNRYTVGVATERQKMNICCSFICSSVCGRPHSVLWAGCVHHSMWGWKSNIRFAISLSSGQWCLSLCTVLLLSVNKCDLSECYEGDSVPGLKLDSALLCVEHLTSKLKYYNFKMLFPQIIESYPKAHQCTFMGMVWQTNSCF